MTIAVNGGKRVKMLRKSVVRLTFTFDESLLYISDISKEITDRGGGWGGGGKC